MHWHTLWCHGNEGMDWVLDVAPEYGDGQCQRANLILSDKTVQSREWKINTVQIRPKRIALAFVKFVFFW